MKKIQVIELKIINGRTEIAPSKKPLFLNPKVENKLVKTLEIAIITNDRMLEYFKSISNLNNKKLNNNDSKAIDAQLDKIDLRQKISN